MQRKNETKTKKGEARAVKNWGRLATGGGGWLSDNDSEEKIGANRLM
jgi:hypothetical protein